MSVSVSDFIVPKPKSYAELEAALLREQQISSALVERCVRQEEQIRRLNCSLDDAEARAARAGAVDKA